MIENYVENINKMAQNNIKLNNKIKRIINISFFSIVIVISTMITIPLVVPITLQIFGVALAIFSLGGRDAFVSILIYILLGIIGLPVFAGSKSGLDVILGPTGGYVIGFLFMALMYYLLVDKNIFIDNDKLASKNKSANVFANKFVHKFADKKYLSLFALFIGLIICYLMGTIWFKLVYLKNSKDITFIGIISICVLPFIVPDIIKILLAMQLYKKLGKHLKLLNDK